MSHPPARSRPRRSRDPARFSAHASAHLGPSSPWAMEFTARPQFGNLVRMTRSPDESASRPISPNPLNFLLRAQEIGLVIVIVALIFLISMNAGSYADESGKQINTFL